MRDKSIKNTFDPWIYNDERYALPCIRYNYFAVASSIYLRFSFDMHALHLGIHKAALVYTYSHSNINYSLMCEPPFAKF